MLSRQERVPITPREECTTKWQIIINEDWCKGCDFCHSFCPRDVLEKSDKFNAKGYYPPIVKNPDNCVGCKLCEALCPEFAIYVESCKSTSGE